MKAAPTRHLLPLRDLAREQAVEILADAAGRRRISELLAVAFLRGYAEAHRDQAAERVTFTGGGYVSVTQP